MGSQDCIRTFLIFCFVMLVVARDAEAQYDGSLGVAFTEYMPPTIGYSASPQSQYLARRPMPSFAPYCAPCQQAGVSVDSMSPCPPSSEAVGYSIDAYGGETSPSYQAAYSRSPRKAWYASAAGLFMGRDKAKRVWTTYEDGNNSNQLMNTHDADPDWEGGADLRIGRFIACDRWVLELGYWSLNNFEASSSQTHASGVSSPLLFNDLEFPFPVGDPVFDYFDSAMEHRLYRTNELHSVELNLIEGQLSGGGCSRWSHRMLAGVRYFKFDENLTFASLNLGGVWGGNGGLDEVNMNIRTKNDLVGAQIGCLFERQLGCRTRFYLSPKFGVYNNHIEHSFDLRRGDGTAAIPRLGSGVTGSYPVESSTDVVAFLSEANLGLQYQASRCWTIFGGYRVVVLTNVGLADNQIPQFIVDIPEISRIDTEGSLVLQGAMFGASRNF